MIEAGSRLQIAGGRSLPSQGILAANERALRERPFLRPGYEFSPISTRKKELHELRSRFPYRGFVNVEVEGVEPFVMFSNNDDLVAQTYFWYGPDTFESFSLRVWRTLASGAGTVLDIGAFSGLYSLVAARANPQAQVHAFEPLGQVFGRLVTNLQANGYGRRVEVYNLALGDRDTRTYLNLVRSHLVLSAGSSLAEKKSQKTHARQPVEVRSLDSLARERGIRGVALAKLDVETVEESVIEGARETIEASRPALLIEVFSGSNLERLRTLLEPYGYSHAVLDEKRQSADVGATDLPGVANVLFMAKPRAEVAALLGSVRPLSYTCRRSSGGLLPRRLESYARESLSPSGLASLIPFALRARGAARSVLRSAFFRLRSEVRKRRK